MKKAIAVIKLILTTAFYFALFIALQFGWCWVKYRTFDPLQWNTDTLELLSLITAISFLLVFIETVEKTQKIIRK